MYLYGASAVPDQFKVHQSNHLGRTMDLGPNWIQYVLLLSTLSTTSRREISFGALIPWEPSL